VARAARPKAGLIQISTSGALQNFILDFVCFEKRLVIEIDGSRHASSETDPATDAVLQAEGFRIARYWNNDVLQRASVVAEDVFAKLAEP